MPAIWFALSGAAAMAAQLAKQTAVDEALTIQWRTIEAFPDEGKVVYGGGVKAVYGVTTLTADSITLFVSGERAESGLAEGKVRIEDPEGTVDAERMAFNWREKTGDASRVRVRVDLMELEAQRLEVQPGKWVLTNVKVIQCAEGPALFSLWSPSVTIEPGKRTTLRKVDVALFGKKILTLRKHEVSLDRKSDGLRLPSVSIRRGQGLGVTWQNGVPLTNSTYTDFRFSTFPRRRPSASLTVSQSLIKPEKVTTLITPRSDTSEPFNYGYLENVNVKKPEDERRYLAHQRATVSVGSVLNSGVRGGGGRDTINKPWDIAVEYGGAFSGFAQMSQIRFQNVQDIGNKTETRTVGITSILSPEWRISDGVFLQARGDGRIYFNDHGSSHWGRLSGELIAQVSKQVRLGLGYSVGGNSGTFAFDFDRLDREKTLHVRGDFHLGPTRIYALGKYDPRGRDWFDTEFAIYQLAGCFEPYILYRRQSGTASIGFNWRVFETFDRLKDKLPKRTKGNRPLPPPSFEDLP